MPYEEALEARVRQVVAAWPDTERRKMFGGVCFLGHGRMICGVWKDYLILRLGDVEAARALAEPGVAPFDVTGRPMKGWVMVHHDRLADDPVLGDWLDRARTFHAKLPPK